MVPVMAPDIDVNWLSSVKCKTIPESGRDYRRDRGISGDDTSQPDVIPADVIDDVDDIFTQGALWVGNEGSSFTASDRSAIVTALARLSKKVTTSGSEFANLVKDLLDELEASDAATAERGREVRRQKGLVSIAKRSANNILNDVASLRRWVTIASTREKKLLSSPLAASSQISRASSELLQANDTILMKSRKFKTIEQLKMSIRSGG